MLATVTILYITSLVHIYNGKLVPFDHPPSITPPPSVFQTFEN